MAATHCSKLAVVLADGVILWQQLADRPLMPLANDLPICRSGFFVAPWRVLQHPYFKHKAGLTEHQLVHSAPGVNSAI